MPKTKQKTVSLLSITVEERFRKNFGDAKEGRESFESLKSSIRENGLIEPIVVLDKGNNTFSLVAGGRRLEAVKQLEWTEIPCHIFPVGTTNIEKSILELLENYDRKDLTWQEETAARAKIDRLMKEKHGELPRGLTKTNALEKGDSRWSTADTASLTGVNSRSINRDIELSRAMEAFPDEIGRAPTKAAAIRKLERIKAETGLPLISVSTPDTEALQTAIKEKLWKHGDWRPYEEKLKVWSPNLIILTSPTSVDEDTLADFYSLLGPNGWIVSFSPLCYKHKLAILTWTPRVGVELQELQNNYLFFYYSMKGAPVLNKRGRPAVFSFKSVPPNLRVSPDELSIEFWQEVIDTFVGKGGRVLVPDCREGNMLLGAMNIGSAIFGFSKDEDLYGTYVKKVDMYPPGQYTSFPGSLSGAMLEEL